MKCENCQEEHQGEYGSGRFCTCKCARGFSTKAKRKEINAKVSSWNKVNNPSTYIEICCKQCGKSKTLRIGKINQVFCSHTCASKFNNAKPEVKEKLRTARLREIEKGNVGYGIKCYHGDIRCDSALEYAFIEWYLKDNPDAKIERFKGYLTGNGIKYQPDFIIDDEIIVEVKYETAYIGEKLNDKWKTYVASQESKKRLLKESGRPFLWVTNKTIGNKAYRKSLEKAKIVKLRL